MYTYLVKIDEQNDNPVSHLLGISYISLSIVQNFATICAPKQRDPYVKDGSIHPINSNLKFHINMKDPRFLDYK